MKDRSMILLKAAALIIMIFLAGQYWISQRPIHGSIAPQAVIKSHLKDLAICAESYYVEHLQYPDALTTLQVFCKTETLQQQLEKRSAAMQTRYRMDYQHQGDRYLISISNSEGDVWRVSSQATEITHDKKTDAD